ncbi:M15 family metallopeptidase [Emticicia sp. BO119]|uniref:M15 family metallopeptidase n=1 Tax=Emticicia sp. BO119 TaxID=2757768 RepID=UPI001C69C6BE|nr:M15 family metallopeptidase [Emticicia sp. BO119]
MTKPSLISLLAMTVFLMARCSCSNNDITFTVQEDSVYTPQDTVARVVRTDIAALEQQIISQGLIDIQSLDSTIMVELKYSTTDNFLQTDLYGELIHGYLQQKPAEMLVNANKILQKEHPDLRLLVYDAARPLSVQQKFWSALDTIPPAKRVNFVDDPAEGSNHNFGSAVDLTIYDTSAKKILDMGTEYEYFGELASPVLENQMLAKDKLTKEQVDNRLILRNAMTKAGYFKSNNKWWHFNALARSKAKELYKIIQ